MTKSMTRSMTESLTNSMTKSITKSMTKYNKLFNPIKMLLIIPLIFMLLLIILIAYWNYDHYSDTRKIFNGYKNVVPEPFEMKKENFFIYFPSNSGKTSSIKEYCSLYEPVNIFCVDTREWKGYNTFSVNEFDLLKT